MSTFKVTILGLNSSWRGPLSLCVDQNSKDIHSQDLKEVPSTFITENESPLHFSIRDGDSVAKGYVCVDISRLPENSSVSLPIFDAPQLLSELPVQIFEPFLNIKVEIQERGTILHEDVCEQLLLSEKALEQERSKRGSIEIKLNSLMLHFNESAKSAQQRENALIESLRESTEEIDRLKDQVHTLILQQRSFELSNEQLQDTIRRLSNSKSEYLESELASVKKEHASQIQQMKEELEQAKKLADESMKESNAKRASEIRAAKLQLQEENKVLSNKIHKLEDEKEAVTMQLFEAQQQIVQFSVKPSLHRSLQTYLAQHNIEDTFTHVRDNIYMYKEKEICLFINDNDITVQTGRLYMPLEDYVRRNDVTLDLEESFQAFLNFTIPSKMTDSFCENVLNESKNIMQTCPKPESPFKPPKKTVSHLRPSITRSSEKRKPFR